MKLAVTGKGGVGKTTVSALLAKVLSERGHKVIAIDADPDSNLAACMGYSKPETIEPLVNLKELIEERTGVKPGTTGGMFKLNPFVEDIPDKYAVDVDGVKILVTGAVKKGGSGCYCPENSLLRALVSHLLLDKDMALVLDMEAGVEHLSRGTIKSIDYLVMVVNPGRRSIETALRIVGMASDIGIKNVVVIGNKIRSESDKIFLKEALAGIDFVGFLPYDAKIMEAECNGVSVSHANEAVNTAVSDIVTLLERR